MKKAIPANGKIAKDAKETVQECVSEFISFITSEASDKCQREKRKTINGDDLLWAMATLGFEEYIEPLKVYLQKYRETEGDSKLAGKSGDVSVKKDALGPHGGSSGTSAQGMGQQVAYNPGMVYMQPQRSISDYNFQHSMSTCNVFFFGTRNLFVRDNRNSLITIMGTSQTEDMDHLSDCCSSACLVVAVIRFRIIWVFGGDITPPGVVCPELAVSDS
uniref:Nuclear transcription factor Y subunit B n=1 Tax=Aegilops tauschii TaxID=37682 RepID=R7WD11_AEGTA